VPLKKERGEGVCIKGGKKKRVGKGGDGRKSITFLRFKEFTNKRNLGILSVRRGGEEIRVVMVEVTSPQTTRAQMMLLKEEKTRGERHW